MADLQLITALALVTVSILLVAARWSRGNGVDTPPSPPSLPLLGHLHLLSKPLHRSLAALANGAPLMSLRPARAGVIHARRRRGVLHGARRRAGGAAGAAGRRAARVRVHHGGVGVARRPLARPAPVPRRRALLLAARAADRRAEVAALVANLRADSAPAVALRPRLFELVPNVMMRAVTGARGRAADRRLFQEIVEETFVVSGAPCFGDFYPALRWVDWLCGSDAKLALLQSRRDAFVSALVRDRRRSRDGAGGPDAEKKKICAIDELLALQEIDPEYYTDTVIKGLVLVLLTAGTDTSALTMEWAMAELLTHPDAMRKARAELDATVGTTRLVEESDIRNLPYIQSVVKETLRLRPVGPVIPAHEAMEDCVVGGFRVRRGTMVLVNAWAIHRDPKLWDAAEEFRPERFLDSTATAAPPTLPFGLGRRRCPGEGLALRLVTLALAALLQCFEWEVGGGGVDLAEGVGLTMPMATPLVAVCRPRDFVEELVVSGST